MEKESVGKRIRPMIIYDIILNNADEDHPISSVEILKRLEKCSISCTRQTLYSDIKLLNDYDYEICACKDKQRNAYFVSDRKYDNVELHMLIDAVQALSFFTPQRTKELTDKIASHAGSYGSEVLKKNIVVLNTQKHPNETIYNVNAIIQAILNRKQIEFRYYDYNANKKKVFRRNGEVYIETPCATVVSESNYYLITYNQDDAGFRRYRVDKMCNVVELDRDASDYDEIDLGKYKEQLFEMYDGDDYIVSMVCSNKLINVILDRFGMGVNFISCGSLGDKSRFEVEVRVSPRFIAWACSFGKDLEIISPKTVRDMAEEYVKNLAELYKIFDYNQ